VQRKDDVSTSPPNAHQHSIITFSSSIILRTPAALIIEYSPETWIEMEKMLIRGEEMGTIEKQKPKSKVLSVKYKALLNEATMLFLLNLGIGWQTPE
jgi:hypothetical protein